VLVAAAIGTSVAVVMLAQGRSIASPSGAAPGASSTAVPATPNRATRVAATRTAAWPGRIATMTAVAPRQNPLRTAAAGIPTAALEGRARSARLACGGPNPYAVVAVFAKKFPENVVSGAPALLMFHDTQGTAPEVLATHRDIGAVYGVAFDWRRGVVYAAAYTKRLAPYGPGGPGAVYAVDLATGAARTFATLPNGPDCHRLDINLDAAVTACVGRTARVTPSSPRTAAPCWWWTSMTGASIASRCPTARTSAPSPMAR
jgi:hypothetical protein